MAVELGPPYRKFNQDCRDGEEGEKEGRGGGKVRECVSLCRDGGSKNGRRIRRGVYKSLMRLGCRCHHLWEMHESWHQKLD